MNKLLRLFLKITYPLLVLLLLFTLLLTYMYYEYAEECRNQFETFLFATHIVVAIDYYHKENNEYPQSIDELVPKYLPQRYPATWGSSGWIYVKEENGFYLAVGYGSREGMLYPNFQYNSSSRIWLYDN